MIEPDRLISAVSGRERDEQLDRAIRIEDQVRRLFL
ncbi:hypothetical protein, partial [Pseudomonas aeruginosa]